MAEILYTQVVCDGLDVKVKLTNGEETFFHFASEPDDIQMSVDSMEINLNIEDPEIIPTVPAQDSPIEAEFKKQRDLAKMTAIGFIHSNPECTEQQAVAVANAVAPLLNGVYFFGMYIVGAYEQGMIPEPTFEAFKNLILSMTAEQLMEI